MKSFEQILQLEGLDFIKQLLEFEQQRFDDCFFSKPKSVFEQINLEFGIFPDFNPYPVYFSGDITKPKGKMIFIGINPGFGKIADQQREKEYLQANGLFEGYRNIFSDYYKIHYPRPFSIFGNIKSFIIRYDKNVKNNGIDWDWFQENTILLEMIPYHSPNSAGLRINNLTQYINTHFKAITKIIEYIDPKEPIFITGFPKFERYFHDVLFKKIVSFDKAGLVCKGKINGEYNFIGIPFLNHPKGGLDQIISDINSA